MASETYIAILKAYLVVAENLGKDKIVAEIKEEIKRALTEKDYEPKTPEEETD